MDTGKVRRVRKGLTPVEAAWVTQVSPKAINATIDRGELPKRARGRGLSPSEALYLILRREVGEALTAEAKRELYDKVNRLQINTFGTLASQGKKDERGILLAGGRLRVDITPACLSLAKRWKALEIAMQEIVQDPKIRNGEPVVRGTRVPVYVLADLIGQGANAKEILEDYPALTAAKLRAALAYAQTHPKRGRPVKAGNAVE